MAFTDALFDGISVLDGVTARLASTLDDVSRMLGDRQCIPVSDMPLIDLLDALRPDVVVDARMRKHSEPEDQRHLAPITVGLGPGFAVGQNCTVAVETAWGDSLGMVEREGAPRALAGEPRPLNGVGRERFIYAPHDGTWRTNLTLGAQVQVGDLVGHLGGVAVSAPLSGALRGLAHDGARVLPRQKIVEVDPRTEPDVFGLGIRPKKIAIGVCEALGMDNKS